MAKEYKYKGIVQNSYDGGNVSYPHLPPDVEQEITQEMARRLRYNSGFDPSIYAYKPLKEAGTMSQQYIENHEVGRPPENVFLYPGDSFLNFRTGQRGTVEGFSSNNKPMVTYNDGSSEEVIKQNWLPPVEVKAKRHRPADDLDKMFLGMMAVPFAAYGAGQVAPLIGSGLSSGLSALNAWQAAHPVLSAAVDAAIAGHGLCDATQNGVNIGNALEMIPLAGITYRGAKTGYNTAKAAIESRSLGKPSEAAISELYPVGNPQVRTRLGDVEINNPQLAYRQGKPSIINDFLENDIVRVPDGEYAARIISGNNGRKFDIGRSFSNPMFAQGGLWYGIPSENSKLTGLLTTAEPLKLATKESNGVKYIGNGTFDMRTSTANERRRIPMYEDQLNSSNTDAFIFDPSYGYRKVTREPPAISWENATSANNNLGISSLSQGDNFGVNDVRYLKGMDIYGNLYELPVRTMRGGVKDINGNIISDEELVANWKRSQDFYKMRLRSMGINQKGHTIVGNKDAIVSEVQKKIDPSISATKINEQIENSGGGFAVSEIGFGAIDKKLNTLGKQRRGTTNTAKIHEDAHLMRNKSEIKNMEKINWSNLKLDKDEAAARGTQIKSMLGIKDGTPITSEQLKYMKDNYVRLTGSDNFMQVFLNSITDFDNAAAWLSKNSYSLGGALNLLDYDFLKHPHDIKGF